MKLPFFVMRLLILWGVVSLTVCYAEPVNLGLLKKEVVAYHDSGLYQKELQGTLKKAQAYLVQRAQLNQESKHPQKLALVLDIDETSLSNYNKLVKRDFSGNLKQIHKEILTASSSVIPPMLVLYQEARRLGIHVFFVTGRLPVARAATIKNLKQAGYRHWAGLFLKPNSYHRASVIPFKAGVRAHITKQGYTIVASIGDQYSDIKGGYTEKGFKLPNPFYHIP